MTDLLSMQAPWQQDGKGVSGDAIKVFHQSAAEQLTVDQVKATSISDRQQSVVQQPMPLLQADLLRPMASGGTGAPSGTKELIVIDNGTPNFYNFAADFVGPV